jgi:predicted kinase
MRVYRYYLVYRALVRAKVAMIRRGAAAAGAEEIAGHIELARIKAAPGTPAVILMHGYSGSGKSRIASELAQRLPAIQVRSDLERKRLHGLAALARSESPPAGGIYSPESNRRTLEALASAAEAIVAGGETAVLDATFLAAADRRRFSALAQHANVPFAIVDCHCERPELERRIAVRAQSQDDPSEADIAVLKRQVVQAEPLTADEQRRTLTVDTDKPLDLESIVRMLRGRV